MVAGRSSKTLNRSKYGIYGKIASLENAINVDDLREYGDPSGTAGDFTD